MYSSSSSSIPSPGNHGYHPKFPDSSQLPPKKRYLLPSAKRLPPSDLTPLKGRAKPASSKIAEVSPSKKAKVHKSATQPASSASTEVIRAGIAVFNEMDIPPATPDKNIFCFLIHNFSDGIGDFMHGVDFVEKSAPLLHAKGYKVYGIITLYYDVNRPDSPESKNGEHILTFLQNGLFDDYLTLVVEPKYDQIMAGDQPSKWVNHIIDNWKKSTARKTKLKELRNHTAGVIEVSIPSPRYFKEAIFPNVAVIKCYEYGVAVIPDEFKNIRIARKPYERLEYAAMGSLVKGKDVGYGIKMLANDPLLTREERLITLHEQEPDFVRALLQTTKVNRTTVHNYFKSHYFMPGYLQTQKDAVIFITAQLLRYKDEMEQGKVCDFFLPKATVKSAAIKRHMQLHGFNPDDLEIIDAKHPQKNPDAKVRIFCFRIESDESYQSLYQLSAGSCAASGDNSITLAFSANDIPWYATKEIVPIIYFFCKEIPLLVDHLLAQARASNHQEQIEGLLYFKRYISVLNYIGVKSRIYEDDCVEIATILKEPTVHEAWKIVLNELRKNNYYDQIPNAIKASILFSSDSKEVVADCMKHSKEIQRLLADDIVTEEELNRWDYKFYNFILEEKIYELITEVGISPAVLFKLFPKPPFPELTDFYSKFVRFKSKSSSFNSLGLEEAKTLFKSPILVAAVTFGVISADYLSSHKMKFLMTPENRWWSIIAEIVDEFSLHDNLSKTVKEYLIHENPAPFDLMLDLLTFVDRETRDNIKENFPNNLPASSVSDFHFSYIEEKLDELG